jgi:hypothetical protein
MWPNDPAAGRRWRPYVIVRSFYFVAYITLI